MKQYKELLQRIIDEGVDKGDRTGTGTRSIFGHQSRYDLREGFPLLTLKKTHWKSIAHEMLWFLQGSTNVKYLQDNGVTIWDEWADENGDLQKIYGYQWRNFDGTEDRKGTDQIKWLENRIITHPDCRRMIVSAWNPNQLGEMALPPCHSFFQVYTVEGPDNSRYVDLQMYQRSCDTILGVPFNVASYALLLEMICATSYRKTGKTHTPRYLIHTLGDAHIYSNHMDAARELLTREEFPLPTLTIWGQESLVDYKFDNFVIMNYKSHPAMKLPVAV